MAQNIVAAYLVGGRFFELKTVQKLDSLQFDKPCIDARDEGYNTEWSTELSLEQAYDEYVKAWILLHLIESVFDMRITAKCSFIFNMSVGYDLEGIKTPRMDLFINSLTDASGHPVFRQHLEELDSFIRDTNFSEVLHIKGKVKSLENISRVISPHITRSVTLSTMHGCPPQDIEAICRYLMEEKKLHTFVKLNPTLLGYTRVREILNNLGFNYIDLKESTFTHDLQWNDAIRMLRRLYKLSVDCGRNFGVKLSNTLGTVNTLGVLPGKEMYLSGRILIPITITLASHLSCEFEGTLPISYSGGASQLNILRIFETGIKPITVATELLKPGGYMRMAEIARKLEPMIEERRQLEVIDVEKLDRLAEEALRENYYRKDWRGTKKVFIDRELPLTDCYIAPCVLSCPIRQDIPEYIRLAGDGQYDKALELIYLKNPLHTTSTITH
ncbi:MAG: putative selenate reductase subunit YgfK, partial [Candidatus Mariimomonas ferrooxydans]